MEQQLIAMTQKELQRYEIIKNLIKGLVNSSEAAAVKPLNKSVSRYGR
jgi:hypothetical protein